MDFPPGFLSYSVATQTAFFAEEDPVSGQVVAVPHPLEIGPEHAGLIPKTRRTFTRTRPSTPKTVTLNPHLREEYTEMALARNWQEAQNCPYAASFWADVQKLMLAQPDLREKRAREIVRERAPRRFEAAFHFDQNSRIRLAILAEEEAAPGTGERELHARVSLKLPAEYRAWRLA